MNIKEIDVETLDQKLKSVQPPFVLDVREQHEYDFVNIGAKLIPLGQLADRVNEIADMKDKEVIIHCRSGVRSLEACKILESAGFKDVANLSGGILDWARKIDTDLPLY